MKIDFKKLFLDNLGTKQTILKNTFWLAAGEGITRFLKLILIIYVARILGATEYGKFTFALAFVTLFVIFSDLGLSQITTREFAREKEREKEFPAILLLKILLSLGILLFILISSFFVAPDPVIQKAIWILAIYVLISNFSEIIYAFLRARQKMEYESWAKILQAFVIAAVGFFVLFNFPSVENLSYSYLFASLVALIFILLFFHFKVFHLGFSWNSLIWKRFLGMAWPLGLGTIFAIIYLHIDSVMMGFFGQITQTGWYNAAYRIITATLIPMYLISQSFYPVLSSSFKESKEKLQRVWNYQMETMILLAVPLMVGGIALAPRIIDFVYNPSFAPSVLAFQILIVMAGITFFYNPFGQALIVSNQQKKFFWITMSGAAINVILNFILIPKFSLYGAAFTTVVTVLFILFLFIKFTSESTPIRPFNLKFLLISLGAGLSSIPMFFLIIQPKIYNLNVFLSVLIGVGIYSICFFAYRKLLSKKLR